MKKLVYLLILSLCVNGLAGGCFVWQPTARAETKTAAKAKKSSTKKSKKDKSSKEKSSKQEKNKVAKEKEYTLDLAENGRVSLSEILKLTKVDIKLNDVKMIRLENKKDQKYIEWKADKENKGDYIFTVLKDFKEVRFRVMTGKTDKLVVLKNGKKGSASDKKKTEKDVKPTKKPKQEPTKAPDKEKKKDTDEEKQEAPAEDAKEYRAEEEQEAPAGDAQASDVEAEQEAPAGDAQASDAEEEQEAPAEENDNAVTEDANKQTEVGNETGAPENTDESKDDETEQTEVSESTGTDGDADTSSDEQEEMTQTTDAVTEAPGNATEGEGDPAEDQNPEDQNPEDQNSEGQNPEDQNPEDQNPEGQNPEGQDPEDQNPEDQNPEDQNPEDQNPEDQNPEDQNPEDQNPEEQNPEGQNKESPEAWFKRGTELVWGKLEEVVGQLNGGETVYIQSGKLMLIHEAQTQLLSTVTMVPDSDVFKGSYSVKLSTDNPAIVAEPTLLQPVQLTSLGEKVDLYVWVSQDEDRKPESEEQGEDGEKPVLTVTATDFEPSGWNRKQPQFTLSGIPKDKNWSYAAIIYDEKIVPIAANVYTPGQEGIYTLRFAMLDEIGDIMASSEQYTMQLDWTAPEVTIEVDEETSYRLNISATDNASGLDKVSVDSGKTWHDIKTGEYEVTESEEKTFGVGAIRVRDVAGNVYKSDEEYTVTEAEEEEGEEEGEGEGEGEDEGPDGGGSGGGGSGDGSNTPALPHSRGDGEEGADYDALILDLPDEPMEQLTVGGEAMDLTLMLASAQQPDAPVGVNQSFTAQLRHWKDAANNDAPNTLLLDAEIDGNLGDTFTYEWRFNGEVYRMLANSGIKYVALKVRNVVAAFPTEGFTGGTRYTELKMQGVSTRKFDYTLTMKLNLDPSHVSAMTESDYSPECDLSIHTQVEDKNYELSNSPQSMMYFYNVFVGPEDMMDQPFGEYDANA